MGFDMFSRFFIEPLMVKNAMDREREAVDSEFQGYMPSDGWRLRQLFVSIAKPNHPVAKCNVGNKESLSKENDDSVHEKLHKFRDLHYNAEAMTLVLQSQDTLDALESIAVDMFCKVPNNGPLRETFDHFEKPFDVPEFHKIYKIVPVENYHGVNLS